MTATNALVGRWMRVLLVAGALVAAALFVAGETRPAAASHTEILVSLSSSNPNAVSNIILIVGGTPQTAYIWAKNVDNNYGAGAFQVGFDYDDDLFSVTQLTGSSTWLASTGRSVSCPPPAWATIPPYVRPIPSHPAGLWEGLISCTTTGAGVGPSCANAHCNGLLTTITVTPGPTNGTAYLDLTAGSYILNTQVTDPPTFIEASIPNLPVIVVQCADFNGDGSVTADDITAVAARFLWTEQTPGWDPIYDLTDDGAVTADDITATAMQFLRLCEQ